MVGWSWSGFVFSDFCAYFNDFCFFMIDFMFILCLIADRRWVKEANWVWTLDIRFFIVLEHKKEKNFLIQLYGLIVVCIQFLVIHIEKGHMRFKIFFCFVFHGILGSQTEGLMSLWFWNSCYAYVYESLQECFLSFWSFDFLEWSWHPGTVKKLTLIFIYFFNSFCKYHMFQFLLLGAVPFPKDVPRLKQLGVGGVITLNEPYETLVPTSLYHVSGSWQYDAVRLLSLILIWFCGFCNWRLWVYHIRIITKAYKSNYNK